MDYMSAKTVIPSFTLVIQPGWTIRVNGRGSSVAYTFLRHVVTDSGDEWLECAAPNGANRAFGLDRLVAVEIPERN